MRDYKKNPLINHGVMGKELPPKEDFVEIFINQNMSVKETAEFFGVTKKFIYYLEKHFNVFKPKALINAVKTRAFKKRNYAECLRKRRETCVKRYGTDSVSKLTSIKEHKKQTFLRKYGVSCSVQLPDVREKVKESCLRKYGTETPFQRPDLMKQIFQEKYGVDNPGQMRDHVSKVNKTCLDKYGVPFSGQAEEVKAHQKETFLKNWGVESPLQLPDMQQKMSDARYHAGMGRSKFEKKVEAFIKGFNIPYETNVFKATVNEIDIFFPSLNVAIECNGDYWHSTKNKDKHFHYNKTKFCRDRGISLLHIFECEWYNKPDIVKSVIAARLGKYEVKYRSDKAIVTEEAYTAEIKAFFNTNHIQGAYAHACHCFCLRDKKTNKLMSCMLFSKDTRNQKYSIILSRFCSLIGYQIPYAATRLFKSFLAKHPEYPDICSYADRRLFNGTLYEKLGFTLASSTGADYFYIFDGEIHNKTVGMKSVLRKKYPNLDYTKPESQLTDSLGWLKVYDCGKDVWVYKAK